MSDVVTVVELRGRLTLDDSAWKASIDRAKADVDELTRDRDTSIRVRVDDAAALAQIAALRAELDRLRNQPPIPIPVPPPGGGGGGGAGGALGGSGSIPLIVPAIAAALTLVGPLTATAVAGLSDVGAAAGVAALGFEGLKADMAAGTTTGLALSKQFKALKGDVGELEQTAAQAISGGVLSSLKQVQAELPALRPLVAGLGADLGSALSTTTGGLITGLQVMQPLLQDAGTYAEKLATDFANFTASPEFAQFVAYARQELPIVAKDFADLTTAAVNVAVVLQPVGDGLLKIADNAAQVTTKASQASQAVQGLSNGLANYAASQGSKQSDTSKSFLSRFVAGLNASSVDPTRVPSEEHDSTKSPAPTNADLKSLYPDPQQQIQGAAAAAAAVAAQQAQIAALGKLQAQFGLTSAQADSFTNIMGRNSGELADGAITLSQYQQALVGVSNAENTATGTTSDLLGAYTTFAASAGTAADKATLIGAVLKASNGDALSYAGAMVNVATANQSFVTDFDNARFAAEKAKTSFTNVTTGVINLKTGALNYHNAAAGPLISDLQQLQDAATAAASATYQHEVATKGQATAAQDAATVFKTDTNGALVAEAKQLGLTAGQAQALATQYFNMPASTTTTVKSIGLSDVNETLSNLLTVLESISGKEFDFTVVGKLAGVGTNVGQAIHDAVNNIPTKAGGGLLSGPGTGTSDSMLAAVSNGEFVTKAAATKKNLAALQAGNNGAQLVALPHYADGGFVGVTAPVNPATTAAAKSSASAQKAAASKAASLATSQGNIEFTISADVSKVLGAGTLSAVKTAVGTLINAVHSGLSKGIGSNQLIASLQAENSQISALVTKRATDYAALSAATAKLAADEQKYVDERTTVSSAVTGNLNINSLGSSTFDVFGGTSATGSVSDAISALQSRVTQAGDFNSDLAKLKTLGLNPALIQQIGEAGVSGGGASASELAGASKAQIAQINALNGKINSYGAAAGTQVAGSLYGSTISADASAVKAAGQKVVLEDQSVAHMAAVIANQIAHLGIAVTTDSSKLLGVIKAEVTANNKALSNAGKYR